MVKCDVCGKSTLLPEKLGDAQICKICFMKANGPLWKYRPYDRFGDAEAQRAKALETVQKLGYPQSISDGVNAFFDAQEKNMTGCDACGEAVHTLKPIGRAQVCKKCLRKIETKEWKETLYESNEDVETNRSKMLSVASKNNFPAIIIEDINEHFDEMLQKDLYRIKDGKVGQILKVYETHCVLDTTDAFKAEDIAKQYKSALKKSTPGSTLLPDAAGEAIVRGILTGSIVKAGVSLATSAAINAVGGKIVPSKATYKVIKGALTIQYNDFDGLDYQNAADKEIGFLRFKNSEYGDNPGEDIVFFFKDNSHIKQIFEYIQGKMNEAQKPAPAPQVAAPVSVADEILKFKHLLDIGALTQEEYDAKKKELLNL